MELFLNCTEYYKETKNADFSIQKLAQHKVVEHMQKKTKKNPGMPQDIKIGR